ncbi:MAG TPA: hypothetical protein VE466_01640, partial [Acidimicrobiales bacterium]|nr:hypothetical protein [Acidimicrobiales bacterium]
RNAIAHGLWALSEHPEQKRRWLDDIDGLTPTADEEIVRWASPVIHFRRTVTTDGTRLGDHIFSAGEKVVLWYWSGNRDEAVFAARTGSTSAARPTTTSASAAPAPTSASAPTWRAGRSR